MFKFIRSDLSQFNAYKAHPGSDSAEPVPIQFDRLDTNESPLDLPPEIKEKLAGIYQKVIETNRYPDGGYETLKNAISEYVNESANLSNSTFTAANISVGNGSDELIRSLLIATSLGGEGSILVANPTFSMYGILAQTLAIPVVTIGRNQSNFETDLEAAKSAIKQTQNPPIRVVFVVHPNSPTGNCLTTREIEWLKSLPEEILVVIDEAYFEFSQTTLVTELLQHPNWIILRTFSKAFRLAAMRVGYCIAHPNAIAILEKVRLPYNLPSFSITSALMALENRQLLLESIPQTLSERTKMITVLSSHPNLEITPSTTNFIYLRVKTDDSHSLATFLTKINQKLRSQGTLIRLLPSGLRITIGTPAENTRTLERIQAVLK
ncbi:histidinol-phosphate transaminase [Aphanizomenon flos-aquae NRERC-008]|jgi:histidinol-phosphate aminotransferase|uniref:Histidinol-phosphate aminotransferase n=1 Tax=Aphanizomenon flos-aquae FACHB-1249 TaxID=2692889 RepID=A0ABR8IUG9_APHFL|nr:MULTISPECIES: histidinol-phosphate transaminase [Aphanizomenon]QSV66370.1 MAG: histidinol-phosphate transaminase [Aphanizomenon flos-aquae DEX188]MBD2390195.1 histidinol-phosphate transaminase [Aphanizomenon flos-aquae FACHB-1171]MBD2555780.1 histidinol-phosphate transaminase [Aphanizomenon flos-aquae FACHB-1290]MBD2631841.1 histidinol-phosphate transaminase [Aphanizomenon sp. FACHB-1399]MBD2642707.1 histidinol-phosphate transaminase [Aphanizomenon sp. FACHB-1401]